jgi:F-type H+-transporting ATPase subunit b
LVEQAKAEALAERDRQVTAAEAEIQQAANQAREALRTRVAELSVAGASRVIEKEIDPQRHRELFDKLAAEL